MFATVLHERSLSMVISYMLLVIRPRPFALHSPKYPHPVTILRRDYENNVTKA